MFQCFLCDLKHHQKSFIKSTVKFKRADLTSRNVLSIQKITSKCPKTCGICGGEISTLAPPGGSSTSAPSPPPPPCKDKINTRKCSQLSKYCYDTWIKKKCKKTCGFC